MEDELERYEPTEKEKLPANLPPEVDQFQFVIIFKF